MRFLLFIKMVVTSFLKGNIGTIKNFEFYRLWSKYLNPGYSPMTVEIPWLTFTAIGFIKKNIDHSSKVFEYGGGGSTIFFLKVADKVITIEHDKNWFDILKESVMNKNLTNWEGHFIPPEMNEAVIQRDISNPDDYASRDNNFKNATFIKYASIIDSYPDDFFDWILIDGRARPSCLKHSFDKLKPGGFLILDNAERSYYTSSHKTILEGAFTLLINDFGPLPFSSSFSQTNIWKKNI